MANGTREYRYVKEQEIRDAIWAAEEDDLFASSTNVETATMNVMRLFDIHSTSEHGRGPCWCDPEVIEVEAATLRTGTVTLDFEDLSIIPGSFVPDE